MSKLLGLTALALLALASLLALKTSIPPQAPLFMAVFAMMLGLGALILRRIYA